MVMCFDHRSSYKEPQQSCLQTYPTVSTSDFSLQTPASLAILKWQPLHPDLVGFTGLLLIRELPATCFFAEACKLDEVLAFV